MICIEARSLLGHTIQAACEDAARISGLLGCAVAFTFNDVSLMARPGCTANELIDRYWGEMAPADEADKP